MEHWRRADGVLWRRTASGAVLHRHGCGDGDVLVLDGPGAALWDALDAPVTAAGLAERVAPGFGATGPAILPDVLGALADLRARGCVVVEAG